MDVTLRPFDNSISTDLYIDYNQENELTYEHIVALIKDMKN